MKNSSLHIQKAQQMLHSLNKKTFMPRHDISKLLKDKDKEKIINAGRENQLTHREHQYNQQFIFTRNSEDQKASR